MKSACHSGCKCQFKVAVKVQDNEILDIKIIGKVPIHTYPLDKFWGKDSTYEQDDKLVFKEQSGDLTMIEGWSRHSTKKINNEWYINEECGEITEMIYCYDYKILEKCNKDGIYIIIVECGCWSDYCWEYGCYEGDSDFECKIIKSKIKSP